MIQVEFNEPIVDGTAADVYQVLEDESTMVGTMIYSQDLDQWNDAEFPGDVADRDPLRCATKMLEHRERFSRMDDGPPYDAATRTGMYDHD